MLQHRRISCQALTRIFLPGKMCKENFPNSYEGHGDQLAFDVGAVDGRACVPGSC